MEGHNQWKVKMNIWKTEIQALDDLESLERWKTEIADMEEALKKDIESSLIDVSKWNTAIQEYLHDNMEVAETFTSIDSHKLVEVKMKKDRKSDNDKPIE